jgi:hypothetical protein
VPDTQNAGGSRQAARSRHGEKEAHIIPGFRRSTGSRRFPPAAFRPRPSGWFYSEDFLAHAPSLVAYVNRYGAGIRGDFKVRFFNYDWSVNDGSQQRTQ